MAEVADLVRSRADWRVAVKGVLGVGDGCGEGGDCVCWSASIISIHDSNRGVQ